MSRRFLILAASVLLTSPVAAEVLQLTTDNFNEKTSGRSVFLKFFAPWCGHCKSLAPTWEKLADDWKSHKIGLVAEVDCTDPAAESLCQEYEIEGFPTLIYGDPQSPEIYEGGRDYETLAEFAKEHISKPVCGVKNIDHCSPEDKKIIEDLRKKAPEELNQLAQSVLDRISKAQEDYDKAVEELQKKYEETTNTFNAEVDAVRAETHYKWVQQVLSETEDKEEASAVGEEL